MRANVILSQIQSVNKNEQHKFVYFGFIAPIKHCHQSN